MQKPKFLGDPFDADYIFGKFTYSEVAICHQFIGVYFLYQEALETLPLVSEMAFRHAGYQRSKTLQGLVQGHVQAREDKERGIANLWISQVVTKALWFLHSQDTPGGNLNQQCDNWQTPNFRLGPLLDKLMQHFDENGIIDLGNYFTQFFWQYLKRMLYKGLMQEAGASFTESQPPHIQYVVGLLNSMNINPAD